MQKAAAGPLSVAKKTPLTRCLLRIACAVALQSSHTAIAGPWITPGDEELRHHLQLLADANLLSTPVTTWPLPWASIRHDLDTANASTLPDHLLWSLQYVRFVLNQQTDSSVRASGRLELSDSEQAIRSFSSTRRESSEANASVDWLGSTFAVHLEGTAVDSAIDDKTFRPDGSYIAAVIGNWAISAGWQERWWGPGWHSSLILSSNARPVPAVALQRNSADAFETPLLSWLGPWQLHTFFGEMDDTTIPNAKLLGLRATAKPFRSLELGLSRTAQWGGDGRPQTASSLWDLISGNDNAGSDGVTKETEPGNQLAGIDARWSFAAADTLSALYLQVIGEDESGALPSRNIYLLGLESGFSSAQWSHRLVLEGANTSSGGSVDKQPNYTYEHGIYLDGYRHLRRPIGASFDNDSQVFTLLGEHFRDNGHQLSWSLSHIELNRDGTNRAEPGGSIFGPDHRKLLLATLGYSIPFADSWKITLGAELYDKEFTINDRSVDSTAVIKLECRL